MFVIILHVFLIISKIKKLIIVVDVVCVCVCAGEGRLKMK